jgi:hypothetical protein
LTVTLQLCGSTGGETTCSASSAASSTTGLAAQPYALPVPPPAAAVPCSDPTVDDLGQVRWFWNAATANGRPVAGYEVHLAGGSSVFPVQSTFFTSTFPSDGTFRDIDVYTLDTLGDRSASALRITCQDQLPPSP